MVCLSKRTIIQKPESYKYVIQTKPLASLLNQTNQYSIKQIYNRHQPMWSNLYGIDLEISSLDLWKILQK